MTYILARHAGEASQIARAADLKPSEWRYLSRPDQLRGTHGVQVWVAECWSDTRSQAEVAELRALLRIRDAKVKTVDCP